MASENPPFGPGAGAGGNGNSSGSGNGNVPRRSSITQAALSNLFSRGPPSSASANAFPGSVNTSFVDPQRRRLSVTTVGLSGTSPTNPTPFGARRSSISTSSGSIDESAVEDDEYASGSIRTAPTTPYVRHLSFGASAMRGYRPAGSPGNGNHPASPPPTRVSIPAAAPRPPHAQGYAVTAALSAAARRPSNALAPGPFTQASNTKHPRASSDNLPSRADQQGFNWSEQLRSRAESSVSGARPAFPPASSPPRNMAHHDRAKSVSEMPRPPVQASAVKPKQESRKPDAFQERILKGDFYMD